MKKKTCNKHFQKMHTYSNHNNFSLSIQSCKSWLMSSLRSCRFLYIPNLHLLVPFLLWPSSLCQILSVFSNFPLYLYVNSLLIFLFWLYSILLPSCLRYFVFSPSNTPFLYVRLILFIYHSDLCCIFHDTSENGLVDIVVHTF